MIKFVCSALPHTFVDKQTLASVFIELIHMLSSMHNCADDWISIVETVELH